MLDQAETSLFGQPSLIHSKVAYMVFTHSYRKTL